MVTCTFKLYLLKCCLKLLDLTVQMYEVGEEPFSQRHLAKKREKPMFSVFFTYSKKMLPLPNGKNMVMLYSHANFYNSLNHSNLKLRIFAENQILDRYFLVSPFFQYVSKFSKWVTPLWKCIKKSRRLHKSFLENKLLQGST